MGNFCEVASECMTAIGIVGAGLWAAYLIQRRRSLEPRAELVHRCQLWNAGNAVFLRIFIDVRNPSEVVLRPGDGATHVQQPPDTIDVEVGSADNWKDIEKIHHLLSSEGVYIEPKEFETLSHDVKLPDGIRYVQIETIVACKRTKEMENFEGDAATAPDLDDEAERWTLATLIDLEQLQPKSLQIRPLNGV